MGRLSRLRYRLWTPREFMPGWVHVPLPRKVANAVARHWLAHWQFWIRVAVGVAGIALAVLLAHNHP